MNLYDARKENPMLEMWGPCHQETCPVGLLLVAVAWGTGAALVAVQTGSRLPAIQDEALILTGVLLNGGPVPPKTLRPTPHDARLRTVVWGLTLYTWQDGRPQLIGSATGLLKNEQSVYRGEAKAIQFAALHLPAGADVTSDCKGAAQLLAAARDVT